jgi:hypothetical protein
MKGGFSMESNETAQAYKDGVSKFENNEIQAYDSTLNFISKATTILTSLEVKTKALASGNKQVSYTKLEMEALARPSWIIGWTRFPSKGQ